MEEAGSFIITFISDLFFKNEVYPAWVKWLSIGGLFILAELVHRAWFVVWFFVGAVCAALVSLLFPDNIPVQFGVFFIASAGSLAGFIYYQSTIPEPDIEDEISPKGHRARCIEKISAQEIGAVNLGGIHYKARLHDPETDIVIDPNETVLVVDFDSADLTVYVKPLEEYSPQSRL